MFSSISNRSYRARISYLPYDPTLDESDAGDFANEIHETSDGQRHGVKSVFPPGTCPEGTTDCIYI